MECLVGFGILGIGLTSVFTLFPFSALTLGQALRDDRTTTCAIMADHSLRDWHYRHVVEPGDNGAFEPYHRAMDDPRSVGYPTNYPPGTFLAVPRNSTEPSYPVLVDPMGAVAGKQAVGDNGETGMPRVNLFLLNNQALALRYCSLMDSMTYDENGTVPNNIDMREMRYNWLWVLQRPVNRDRFTVRMQVVVFNKRTHLYTPPGSESVTSARFTPGDTTITNVPLTADVRKGGWVMDGSIGTTRDAFDGVVRPIRHGEFYRVLSVTEVTDPTTGVTTYSLEVHKPIVRADRLVYTPNTSLYAYTGLLVSMPGVADVYERPNLTAGIGP
jgi:hypothetical protein